MEFKKWGIYRASLDPVVGSEQGKSRPVLIISENQINNLLNTVNVLPLTTKKGERFIYPNEVLLSKNIFGLENESIILCSQIRTLDKKRLTKYYGDVTDNIVQNEILEALCFQLGIIIN